MKRHVPASPRLRAEELVTTWIDSDYEPDDIEPDMPSQRSIEALVARLEDLFRGQMMRPPCQGVESIGRRTLNDGIITIGTPQRASAEVDGEEDVRSPECPAYARCLDHVLVRGWDRWTCRGCDGPGSAAGKVRK